MYVYIYIYICIPGDYSIYILNIFIKEELLSQLYLNVHNDEFYQNYHKNNFNENYNTIYTQRSKTMILPLVRRSCCFSWMRVPVIEGERECLVRYVHM
jgi:hypothetical protein